MTEFLRLYFNAVKQNFVGKPEMETYYFRLQIGNQIAYCLIEKSTDGRLRVNVNELPKHRCFMPL